MGANTSTEPRTFLRIEPDPDGDARRERQLSYEHHMAEQRRLIERLRSDPSKRELALSVRAHESSQHIQSIVSASSVESPAHASSNLVVCIGGLHSCTIGRVHRGTQEQHLDREVRLQLGLGLRTHTLAHTIQSNRISGRRPSISLEIYPCSRCLYVYERVAS